MGKIAFVGMRGIPAKYGGYETFVEEVGERLVRRGFDITVYCRKGSVPSGMTVHKGMRLIQLPTIHNKYFHTVFHTLLSTIHVMFSDRQVVYYCNTVNALFCLLPRLVGKRTIMNTDGLEWKRRKWGWLGRTVYRISEWIVTWAASEIVCDSEGMKEYYLKKFGKKGEQIGYGGSGVREEDTSLLGEKYGLEAGKYFLYVSRLEPENNAHVFVKAYARIKTEMPFIVVGDAPFAEGYIRGLKQAADPKVRFLGYVFGRDYRLLTSHARLYFHGNEVGGTNPGLVEAMSLGNCILAVDVPFNREVLGDTGFFFDPGDEQDLPRKIEMLLKDPVASAEAGRRAGLRARELYNWDKITDQYEIFFGKSRKENAAKKEPAA